MCSLIIMFTVIGSAEIGPGTTRVDILNHDNVVEEFIVPTKQYQKCYPRTAFL